MGLPVMTNANCSLTTDLLFNMKQGCVNVASRGAPSHFVSRIEIVGP